MSEIAFQQFLVLNSEIDGLTLNEENDVWSYIWGNTIFFVKETYTTISGYTQTHPVFSWLWSYKCQPKLKVFFWLLLHGKLNTRDRLRRRNMKLESYTCDNWILQRDETMYHLFLRCSFAINLRLQLHRTGVRYYGIRWDTATTSVVVPLIWLLVTDCTDDATCGSGFNGCSSPIVWLHLRRLHRPVVGCPSPNCLPSISPSPSCLPSISHSLPCSFC
jgi:hypothetical protein